jgi:hypothetical protein
MKNLLKLDFTRLWHGKSFRLASLLVALLGAWDLALNMQAQHAAMAAIAEQQIAYSYPYSVYNACIFADWVYLPATILFATFPLLATLPYGASLAQDVKTGYIKHLVAQAPRWKIIVSRFAATWVGAFVVVITATVGQMVVSMMFLPAVRPEVAAMSFPILSLGKFAPDFYAAHPFLYLTLYAVLDAMLLAFLATLSIPVGWKTGTPFWALIAPTAFYYVFGFVANVFLPSPWNPMYYLSPVSNFMISVPAIATEFVLLSAFSLGCVLQWAKRRHDVL